MAAKQIKLARVEVCLSALLSLFAQTRIGLQLIDDHDEIVQPDDPFKLESSAIIACPDHIGLYPAYHRKPDDDPVTAAQLAGVVDHKSVGREIRDMQVNIAVHEMLDDSRNVDRVTRRAAQIGNTEISSTGHVSRSFPQQYSGKKKCRTKADNS
jgi:hypothetical protein